MYVLKYVFLDYVWYGLSLSLLLLLRFGPYICLVYACDSFDSFVPRDPFIAPRNHSRSDRFSLCFLFFPLTCSACFVRLFVTLV